jgi:hypothetical protein
MFMFDASRRGAFEEAPSMSLFFVFFNDFLSDFEKVLISSARGPFLLPVTAKEWRRLAPELERYLVCVELAERESSHRQSETKECRRPQGTVCPHRHPQD